MNIKKYLENLPLNINDNSQGLYGKELRIVEQYLNGFDELKGKKIEIIEEITPIEEPQIVWSDGGISISQKTEPKIVAIKGFGLLKENIKLYSIYIKGDDIFVRCTDDSIN